MADLVGGLGGGSRGPRGRGHGYTNRIEPIGRWRLGPKVCPLPPRLSLAQVGHILEDWRAGMVRSQPAPVEAPSLCDHVVPN